MDSTERAIGRLEGEVKALTEAVRDGNEDNKQGRSRMYSELEKVREDAAESRREVADLKAKMDAAGPTIAEIKKWKERFIGAWMLTMFLAGMIGASTAAIGKWLAAKFGMPWS
ncbi:uncharacterized protein DUF1515 [Rhizobium subbaraonis]|uniref:Uncharacterized protein DUF1515 n=1 Tax=Rhizobium subbaraonis TaxID=908946 RepID=A0A285V246_9HYPH|nr:DUF1515 family protein [Rhizobium subbaraonis]SOC47658.1 uncharacterized protein DUF1515 [Rhizobium subbaraonis]